MKIIFGVPKEITPGENRVALTPDTVEILTQSGLSVAIQAGAGLNSGFSDEQYLKAGAKVVQNAKDLWDNSKIIVKLKGPQKSEFQYFREDLVIFSFLHLAVEQELMLELLKKKVCAIASEAIKTPDGKLPLLEPMSEIAGKISIQMGARFLENSQYTKGMLLGGAAGVAPAKVVILGCGTVGTNAALCAHNLGADVSVLDVDTRKLNDLKKRAMGGLKTYFSNPSTIEEVAKEADLLICAVSKSSKRAPKLINAQIVKEMKKGSVIIDVAIDQGGNVETVDKITTFEHPVFEKYEVLHCAIPNIPSCTANTSSRAYSYAILPYLKELGEKSTFVALKEDETLSNGVYAFRGNATNEALAEAFNLKHTEISLLIGFRVK